MKGNATHILSAGVALSLASVPWRADSQVSVVPRDSLVTTIVDVDGLSIRVRTAGLDGREPRQPVVIFESGGAAPLETWDRVLPAVANLAPVVAYDRAGTGQSAWDSLPPTPERIVTRLRRLLAKLNVAPPYLLVGHSWGGALIRYVGGATPADIVGMLYIDPTDITLGPADEIAIFEAIGAGAAARDAFDDVMERSMATVSAPLRAEGAVILGILRQDVADRRLPAPPNVATTVILAGKLPVLPASGLPFDTKKYVAAMQENRVHRLRGWVRAPGEFVLAASAGHFVQMDAPDLVIEAIRRLLQIN